MPNSRFLRDMGVASIVAGVILLGLSQLARSRAVKRVSKRVR